MLTTGRLLGLALVLAWPATGYCEESRVETPRLSAHKMAEPEADTTGAARALDRVEEGRSAATGVEIPALDEGEAAPRGVPMGTTGPGRRR